MRNRLVLLLVGLHAGCDGTQPAVRSDRAASSTPEAEAPPRVTLSASNPRRLGAATTRVSWELSDAQHSADALAVEVRLRAGDSDPGEGSGSEAPLAQGMGLLSAEIDASSHAEGRWVRVVVSVRSPEGRKAVASALMRVQKECPQGFSRAKGLAAEGPLCVAKYEMKAENPEGVAGGDGQKPLWNSGNGDFPYDDRPRAASRPDGSPWVNVSRDSASSECAALGAGYRLISNSEWQAVAREVEAQAENWSGGSVAQGTLSPGHSDNDPAGPLAASTSDTVSDSGTNPASPQKRVLKLSSGDVVWDFSGNVHEWVADDLETLGLEPLTSGWTEASSLTGPNREKLGPAGSGALGRVSFGSRGALVRGGAWFDAENAGPFAAHGVMGAGLTLSSFGFRCVYQIPLGSDAAATPRRN